MASIRIKGLVKAMNEVRAHLAAGIPEEEAADFRCHVNQIIAETEAICRQHSTSPSRLPAPSYRAFLYLKAIDLENLPPPEAGSPPRPKRLRIKNLVSACQDLQDQMAALAGLVILGKQLLPIPAPAKKDLLRQIRGQAQAVERLCDQTGANPGALPTRSRRAYQWLKFLSEASNLDLHLATLLAASRLVSEAAGKKKLAGRGRRLWQVELYHMASLYRGRRDGRIHRILLNEGFMGAPEPVLRALVHAATGRKRKVENQKITTYADSDDFIETVQELELTTGSESRTNGRYFDLGKVFEKVNDAYFEGRLDMPALTWNQALTRRKLGHYQPATDTVMISLTLDDPAVPEEVIAFVMYHELLHKSLGIKVVNGRRMAHTPEFRKKERQFEAYEQAQAFFQKLNP